MRLQECSFPSLCLFLTRSCTHAGLNNEIIQQQHWFEWKGGGGGEECFKVMHHDSNASSGESHDIGEKTDFHLLHLLPLWDYLQMCAVTRSPRLTITSSTRKLFRLQLNWRWPRRWPVIRMTAVAVSWISAALVWWKHGLGSEIADQRLRSALTDCRLWLPDLFSI